MADLLNRRNLKPLTHRAYNAWHNQMLGIPTVKPAFW